MALKVGDKAPEFE